MNEKFKCSLHPGQFSYAILLSRMACPLNTLHFNPHTNEQTEEKKNAQNQNE